MNAENQNRRLRAERDEIEIGGGTRPNVRRCLLRASLKEARASLVCFEKEGSNRGSMEGKRQATGNELSMALSPIVSCSYD